MSWRCGWGSPVSFDRCTSRVISTEATRVRLPPLSNQARLSHQRNILGAPPLVPRMFSECRLRVSKRSHRQAVGHLLLPKVETFTYVHMFIYFNGISELLEATLGQNVRPSSVKTPAPSRKNACFNKSSTTQTLVNTTTC